MKRVLVFVFMLFFISFKGYVHADFWENLKSFLERISGVRGEDVDVMPMEAICNPYPVFKWKRVEGVNSYLLKVFEDTEKGSKEVFQIETKEPEFIYPKDAPEIKSGNLYYWMAYDLKTSSALSKGRFYFYLLPETEREKVEKTKSNFQKIFARYPEETYYHFLLASYYNQRGLRQDVKEEMARALKADPNSVTYSKLVEMFRNRYRASHEAIVNARSDLQKAKEDGNQYGEARTYEKIADLLMEQWDVMNAVTHCLSAMNLYHEIGDKEGESRVKERISYLNGIVKTVQECSPFVN